MTSEVERERRKIKLGASEEGRYLRLAENKRNAMASYPQNQRKNILMRNGY